MPTTRATSAYTDDHRAYPPIGKLRTHEAVSHSNKEWVRGPAQTQGIDSFWGLFKRGLIRSYHQVSVKHLNRYRNELRFRFNNQEAEDLFMLVVLNLVAGSPLPCAVLMANTTASTGDDQPF